MATSTSSRHDANDEYAPQPQDYSTEENVKPRRKSTGDLPLFYETTTRAITPPSTSPPSSDGDTITTATTTTAASETGKKYPPRKRKRGRQRKHQVETGDGATEGDEPATDYDGQEDEIEQGGRQVDESRGREEAESELKESG